MFFNKDPNSVRPVALKRGELLFFHMAQKDPPKFTSSAKPPKSSTMTQDEIKEIYHQMEKRITKNTEQMEHNIYETMKTN
jgi:hypothetical protein